MQRVSALLPSWDRRSRSNSTSSAKVPAALDKVFGWAEKIAPVNRINTAAAAPARFGRETYWPTALDRECDKAARILKSFCCDGFLAQQSTSTGAVDSRSSAAYVTQKIPPRIIQNAVGLAVFSCMRSGLWMSGSGGAGLITARKADGTWSPPSGIILHTAALGFVIGVDIYDCVLVINSVQTLELFTRPRLTLGINVSLTVGPLAPVGSLDQDARWNGLDDTVLTYVKARGKHQAVELGGSLVTERGNENERFYCGNVGVLDILAGNIQKSIPEMRPLFEVIKAAEGRSDYDTALMAMLARQPAPGDAVIESPKTSPSSIPKSPFGIPEPEDPDPFGVIGLEMAGIEIREAGTHQRPTSSQFEFNPSPTSPVFARFSRQSIDTYLSRSNRGSCMSAKTVATAMTDAGTQTDVGSSPETSVSRANSDDGRDNTPEKLPTVVEPEEVDYTKIDTSAIEQFRRRSFEEPTMTAVVSAPRAKPEVVDQGVNTDKSEVDSNAPAADERDEDADDEEEEEEDEEEPIICEVATTAQPTRVAIRSPQITQVIQAKGAIVTIPKRIPPPLPPRSPARTSRASKSDFGGDVAALKSPLRGSFLSTDLPTETDYTQHPSDGAADNSSAETVEPEVHGHRNNSSLPAAEDITVEQRRSTDNSSQEPRTPSARELASSAEDSEREPRTPQIEKDFVGLESEKSDMGRVNGVSIVSHNSESNSVLVA
ncbi:hypothetical protein B0T26DRAFT_744710 [Lasiosphaeria miniovina]|uniref:Ysc84 actin-binding domain-containing protein n=1 Tax=Lasiosphaeria miniovina TaxID=1954250 RepID=A0AA39ZQN9_9PEZI|nr:uncharacterized protein B0T26DRAFT_744710 [Lasiosphaeria miniovina]KAK0701655.1 hypothetical protein B0T26DRAFT_744710 [Lasiosphaeria miniovina]